ncbi:MAG: hypothetical protein KC912_25065 [Proteobacteria bacterium]|nr:hypothetical protein [Pseudomonadota bacterium]
MQPTELSTLLLDFVTPEGVQLRNAALSEAPDRVQLLVDMMEAAIATRSWDVFYGAVVAGFDWPSSAYLPVLLRVLDAHADQLPLEEVIALLGETVEPSAADIHAIARAVVPFLTGTPADGGERSLSLKALGTLVNVGHPEAERAATRLSQSGDARTAQMATRRLDRIASLRVEGRFPSPILAVEEG